ncbi:MAG: hypothetical protein ACOYXC_18470, partial [Candidatus Rifleibacteriota bacterium]
MVKIHRLTANSGQKWSEILAKLEFAEEAELFDLEISAEIDSCETGISLPNAVLREVYRRLIAAGFAFDSFSFEPGRASEGGLIRARVQRLPAGKRAPG